MNAKTQLAALEGVGLQLGDARILIEAKLTLEAGEKVGLTGPNGSGKTSLLRLLATLVRPTSGHGTVLGTDLAGDGVYEVRRHIVLIGHLPGLYPELTLLENTRFVARLSGRDPSGADEVLATVGLAGAAGRRAEQCSKGMLRRTELARALLLDPRLLLLDEAHAGLDQEAVGLVDAIADRVVSAGGAAILVSHEPDRLKVDRTLRIVEGRVEAGP